ncbi:hypothetical protein [Haliangium sp.]|uniref:hypothetical protein n=1 Tax=Haliangium sp. TaxID=2663208 RepID=UPI003D099866
MHHHPIREVVERRQQFAREVTLGDATLSPPRGAPRAGSGSVRSTAARGAARALASTIDLLSEISYLNGNPAAAAIVQEEGVPFFEPISSPEKLADWDYLNGKRNAHMREAKAYSLVAAGRIIEGIRALRELAESLAGKDTPWVVEMKERAERLAALAESTPPAAHELLAQWEAETVTALRLQDVP